jgi:hypothetical protein
MPSIDGASLIHHGVGVGDVIEVGGVVEDEAGVGGKQPSDLRLYSRADRI